MEAKVADGQRVGPADMATIYAALDMPQEAYTWLERAVEVGDPGLVGLRTDPVWDPYRDQPEFKEMSRMARGRRPPPPRGSDDS